MQDRLLIRNSKGWFTGQNLAGREGNPRYQAYFGGAPRYRTRVAAIAEAGTRASTCAEPRRAVRRALGSAATLAR